jgi:hypothetical protein
MARALHQDACRDHSLVEWVVWYDHPAYPGRFIAQLATSSPLPYVLVRDTLAGWLTSDRVESATYRPISKRILT